MHELQHPSSIMWSTTYYLV